MTKNNKYLSDTKNQKSVKGAFVSLDGKTGNEIALHTLLDAKENRSQTQRRLLKTFGGTLVCLLVNYVGQVKTNSVTRRIFDEGAKAITQGLAVDYLAINCFETGEEGFFVTQTEAKVAKKILCKIEESHPLGRFMDIDVFDGEGNQISREDIGLDARKCFLCDKDARECYILRRHSGQELKNFVDDTVNRFNENN